MTTSTARLISEATAKVLLQDLMRLVDAHHGLILAEGPPPRTAAEFRSPTRDAAFVLAFHASKQQLIKRRPLDWTT
jgi:hypothetical protein